MTKSIRFTPQIRAGIFAGVACLTAQAAGAVDVPFHTQAPIATSTPAISVVVGDIDRDGDLDVVAAGSGEQLTWHENLTGDGSSWALHTISPPGGGAPALAVADIDGDGDLDILTASFSGNRIAWHENLSGAGTAWADHTIFTSANSAPQSVFAADVDGDGDLDAMSASVNDDRVAWYENVAANGTSWVMRNVTTQASGAVSVFAADVDGDGDTDALSASFSDNKIAWYENTLGNGTVWAIRTISTAADSAWSVSVADVDHDGDLDVLSASVLDARIAWYENTAGNGTIWTTRTISTSAAIGPVVPADLDGDGDVDVVSLSSAPITWHENTFSDGTAWVERTVASSFGSYASVVVADLDRDGDLDVVASSSVSVPIAWHRNLTIHASVCFVTSPPISILPFGPRSVFTGDVDGDGDMDALSASYLDATIAWYENAAGNGTAWTRRTISTDAQVALSVFAGDVDQDGDLDALSASFTDNKVAWYENAAGNGAEWVTRTISTAVPEAASVAAADVDGDGDLDALSASAAAPSRIAWHENLDGSGGAWALRTISQAVARAYRVFAADVDGDGDTDALSASVDDDRVAWYENVAGNGTLWTQRIVSTAGDRPLSVFSADVDGDGDRDILAASVGDGEVAWHENVDGGGTVWTRRTISSASVQARAVVAVDVDADGDRDVLVASDPPSSITLFENISGDGASWVAHTLATQDVEPWALALADVDADGDLDAVAALGSAAQIAQHESRPGQVVLTPSDLAPPGAMNSDLVPMLRLVVAHGGRAGDGSLEVARLGLLFEEAAGDPLTSAEANAVIASLRVYRDANGNGVFDPAADALVASVPTLALAAGVQVVDLTDGDPNLEVSLGTPRTYFVVTELTADASVQSPNRFRVTHLGAGASASVFEDRTYDIPLRAACPADFASTVLGPITPVDLLDFRIE